MHTNNQVETVKLMLSELRAAGFQGEITISYHGSGDSGDTEMSELSVEMQGALEALGYRMGYTDSRVWDYNKNQFVTPDNYNPKHNILGIIDSLMPSGWEINEGSQGEIVLSITNGTVTVKHDWNVMTTEHEQFEY